MRKEHGFSLTELMITLTVFGLVAAFTVPALNRQMTTWNLSSARRTMLSEIALIRQKAISDGRTYRMWVSEGWNLYWFQDVDSGAWTSYEIPDRVTFETARFDASYYDTYFEPSGRSTRSGTIIMRNTVGDRDTIFVDLNGWAGTP